MVCCPMFSAQSMGVESMVSSGALSYAQGAMDAAVLLCVVDCYGFVSKRTSAC